MDKLYTVSLMLFLVVAGLGMVGAGLPRWAVIVGGVAGIIAGVILLIQVF